MGKIYPLICIPLMSMFSFFTLQKVLEPTLFVNRAYAVIAAESQLIVDLKLIVDSPASVMN